MSGNTDRLRWLMIIVIVELLMIAGLVTWAIMHPSDKTAKTETTQKSDVPVTVALVTTGLKNPTDIATTPIASDDRLFVTEQPGTIKIVNKNDGQTLTPFLDLTSKVKYDSAEMGLLGLTFHPNFATNGYFYVDYTDKNDMTTVSRFSVKADGTADPASEKVIFTVKQPYANHNAGGLAFGPDGYLYITLGDGGSGGDPENRAQNKMEFLGKLLRVDVNNGDPYSVPASNPFVSNAEFKPEIWAWGLRNPWRISFDKQTGDLYIADVGQGVVEEVDVQLANSQGGQNYGWRCFEGTKVGNNAGCQDANVYTMPQLEYIHENGRCSITGGYVYHGSTIKKLDGSYIFGDLCTGEIFSTSEKTAWAQKLLVKTPFKISTFGQDQNGEVYVADLNTGSIYSLVTN